MKEAMKWPLVCASSNMYRGSSGKHKANVAGTEADWLQLSLQRAQEVELRSVHSGPSISQALAICGVSRSYLYKPIYM